MGLQAFQIFINERAPGISGGVVINPGPSELNTQGLVLTFKGYALVHWTESRTESSGTGDDSTSRTVTDHYRGFSSIFDYQLYLLGDGHTTTSLSPGETVFPFTFPYDFTNLPCTFKGDHGKVEYMLKATLKRKGLFADHKTKMEVHVNPVLDLNRFPALAEPMQWQKSKTFCCLCCASGPLTMTVRLEATGFCVGEGIPLLVEVNNGSTRKLKSVTAQLIQEVTYRATTKTKRVYSPFPEGIIGQEVGPGDGEVWQRKLALPLAAMPTRLAGGCSIIDVQYYIKVVGHMGAAGANLKLDLPVTIGTIPIRNPHFDGFSSPESAGFTVAPSAPPK